MHSVELTWQAIITLTFAAGLCNQKLQATPQVITLTFAAGLCNQKLKASPQVITLTFAAGLCNQKLGLLHKWSHLHLQQDYAIKNFRLVHKWSHLHLQQDYAVKNFRLVHKWQRNQTTMTVQTNLPSDTVMPFDTHFWMTSSDPGCSGARVRRATLSRLPYMSIRSLKPFFRSHM